MNYTKYLLKVPVRGALLDLLNQEKEAREPSSGFHVTIIFAEVAEKYEKALSDALNKNLVPPFSLKITGLDVFGTKEKPIHVLLTSAPFELRFLHWEAFYHIYTLPKIEVSSRFREHMHTYFLERYRPHISFSKSKKALTLGNYKGIEFPVTSFDFMREKGMGWEKIRSYSLL